MINDHSLAQRLQQLRCLIFDMEGILSVQSRVSRPPFTENLLLDVDRESLKKLIDAGFIVAVISSGRSSLMKKNLLDIGIKWVYMGAYFKIEPYEEIKSLCGLTDSECAHMGDGPADVPLFEKVGFAVTVPHAELSLHHKAHYCTTAQGAWGAVREFADLIFYYQRRCH